MIAIRSNAKGGEGKPRRKSVVGNVVKSIGGRNKDSLRLGRKGARTTKSPGNKSSQR